MADYTLRKVVESDEPWRPSYDVFVDGHRIGYVWGDPLSYGEDVFGNLTWVGRKFEWCATLLVPDYRRLRPRRTGFTVPGVHPDAFRTRRDALDVLVAEYRKAATAELDKALNA